MQPNEKTNSKANLKANLQINEQPKKTWEDPAMTKLDVNGGFDPYYAEGSTFYNIYSQMP
jgi:hypothetical protein